MKFFVFIILLSSILLLTQRGRPLLQISILFLLLMMCLPFYVCAESRYECEWGNCISGSSGADEYCTDGRYFYNYFPQCFGGITQDEYCAIWAKSPSDPECQKSQCLFCGEPPADCKSSAYPSSCGENSAYHHVKIYRRIGEQKWVPEPDQEAKNLGGACLDG